MLLVVLTACHEHMNILESPDGDGDADVDVDVDVDGDGDADADGDGDGDENSPECIDDDDCVVALHVERCCQPNPVAISRAGLDADPCLHELGLPMGDSPEECTHVPCFVCDPIGERFYDARCDGGTCVGVDDFCAPMTAPESATFLDADDLPEGSVEAYRGQVVTVYGMPALGPDSCECYTLGCSVTLRGSVCGDSWACDGTECTSDCTTIVLSRLVVQGYLVDSYSPFTRTWIELWPLHTPYDDCTPFGPNPEGAPCDIFEENQCEEGLICFYWGDTIIGCDGICRPPGTECTPETEIEDCPDDNVCHEGYCV